MFSFLLFFYFIIVNFWNFNCFLFFQFNNLVFHILNAHGFQNHIYFLFANISMLLMCNFCLAIVQTIWNQATPSLWQLANLILFLSIAKTIPTPKWLSPYISYILFCYFCYCLTRSPWSEPKLLDKISLIRPVHFMSKYSN